MKSGSCVSAQTDANQGNSMWQRFTAGYQHAGDDPIARRAIAIESTVENLKTLIESPQSVRMLAEDSIGAAQALNSGWVEGAGILGRGAATTAFTAFVLDGLLLAREAITWKKNRPDGVEVSIWSVKLWK